MTQYERAVIDAAVRWYKYGGDTEPLSWAVATLLANRKRKAEENPTPKEGPSEWWVASDFLNQPMGPYRTAREAWDSIRLETAKSSGRVHPPGTYVYPREQGKGY